MGLDINISLILSRIKEHYNVNNDAELARFLGVPPTTLSNWKSRKTLNWVLIFQKCEEMDFNILIKGITIETPAPDLPGLEKAPPPNADRILEAMRFVESKDDRLQELAEKLGELKYENKVLRKQLGYNNGPIAAETPEK